jgi:hypothetical protein
MTKLGNESEILSVHVPFSIKKRGGRKEIQLPPGAHLQRTHIDNTIVKAIARAFRWQRMLESGIHATLLDLARAEKINPSYVSRVLRLTLLAPEVVETILDGRQGREVTLARLLEPFPDCWNNQLVVRHPVKHPPTPVVPDQIKFNQARAPAQSFAREHQWHASTEVRSEVGAASRHRPSGSADPSE